jgi:tRNA A37 N6-isopentenylltransferase MiaA
MAKIAASELEETICARHEKYVKQQRTWFRDFSEPIPSADVWTRETIENG